MFSDEAFDKANRLLSQRRQQALVTAQLHREELLDKFPQLSELERKLSLTGVQLAKAALAGPDSREQLEQLKKENLALQAQRDQLLKAAGFAPDFLDPPYFCKTCQDTGYIHGRRCACFEAILKAEAYRQIPVPGSREEYSFERFSLDYYPDETAGEPISPRARMASVLAKCRSYAATFTPQGESLMMIGRTGLGKTHLSLAIAGRVIERGFGVVYTTAQGLIDRAERDKFGRDPQGTDAQFLRYAQECDLLILDDLGSEFTTPLAAAVLFNLINSRLLEQRRTIISTNLLPDEIQQKYAERLVSRLLCGYTMLAFAGEDIRLLKSWSKSR